MTETAEQVQQETHRGMAVEFNDLTVRAGERVLMKNASARFEPGAVTLIVGPSGVGKSVLLGILAGLIGKSHDEIRVSGSVTFGGKEVLKARGRRLAGVVFQNCALFDELSPMDNVRFARAHRTHRLEDPTRNNAALSARKLLDELQVPRNVRTASLSGGQRQRLAIARTLAYDPDVILYDEPTSGLDPKGGADFLNLLRELKAEEKAIFMSTHDIFRAKEIADRLGILVEGRLVLELTRDEIKHEDLEALYLRYVAGYQASEDEAAVA